MISRYLYKKLRNSRGASIAASENEHPSDAAPLRAGHGERGGGTTAVTEPVTRATIRSEEDKAVIDARGLTKRYGSLIAVNQVSFHVRRGEIFGLLGPNGAGKTTTLEMLEGLTTPDAGDATVLGESVTRHPRRIKERIGVQLQATALPPKTTVTEAIDLFRSFYARNRSSETLLNEFDLTERAHVFSEALSGGQRQRLSIALALVNDPEVVFLDEPTTGLDPQARLNLWDVITAIQQQGKTVLLTTHYMEEAERLCDRVAVIDRGSIVALDTPVRLVSAYAPGTSVEFETADVNGAARGAWEEISGVDRVEIRGLQVTLHTDEPERVMPALFDPDAPWAAPVRTMRDLRVRTGTLEDVFIALSGRTLRS